MTTIEKQFYNYFLNKGFTIESIFGMMGNAYKESHFKPNNLQDEYNKSFGITDEQYTTAVDNGVYQNFPGDGAGYGLVQWTYRSFKQDLLNLCKSRSKSIADTQCQLDQLYMHLQSEGLLNKLKSMTSIEQATEYFMLKFEKPKDQSQQAIDERIRYAKQYQQQFTQQSNKGGKGNMKYSQSNPPLVCMQTHSTCYQNTSKMQVKGVLWHSTGANNKTLKRYVQPGEDDANYNILINKIGKNTNGNDWNHISIQAGLNAWIGTLANGSVAAVQTMPWDYKPWGCGSGSAGSCNNGWIQFEICEDSLTDQQYFNEVYTEACELTAYLCQLYGINPIGTVDMNGVAVPTLLCHRDSYALGLGTNHSDVYHWFERFGKNMIDVRKDVYQILGGSINSSPYSPKHTEDEKELATCILKRGMTGPQVEALQEALNKLSKSKIEVDGDFGPATEEALKFFQKINGINATGVFEIQTFTTMKAALEKQKAIEALMPKPQTPQYTDVMLGSSSKDENGQYVGGLAGDQTGKEVYILNWYGKNWTSVIRPNSNDLAEKIALACEAGCKNDMIGYSQSTRNTLLAEAKKVNLDLSKIKTPCNCDCSSFVSTCCVCAGIPEATMFPYGNGCTTWTIAEQCLKTGQFTELTDYKYIAQKDYLKRGDILLNKNSHVVIVLSNGQYVPIEQSQNPVENDNKFPYFVRVTADVLNVRGAPSQYSQIVAQVKRNQIYTIVDEEGGFGKLKSGIGWINLSYTEKTI